MASEGTIRIHRSIGGTGAAFRVTFVPYGGEGEEAASSGRAIDRHFEHLPSFSKRGFDSGSSRWPIFLLQESARP